MGKAKIMKYKSNKNIRHKKILSNLILSNNKV